MRGWQELKSYEQLDVYYKWLRENREEIEAELKADYAQFCKQSKSDIAWRSDFGGFVGIPLFVLTVLWTVSAKNDYRWTIAAGMVGLGFWLWYYQKHIADIACRHFFRETKRKILDSYVDRCRAADIEQSISKDDEADIKAFYEYCRSQILSEDFCYYGKGRAKTKRNK